MRYADRKAIFSDPLEGLQELIDSVSDVSKKYKLLLNLEKTKYRVVTRNETNPGQLLLGSSWIERVPKYTYLGPLINGRWDHSLEIEARIEKARAAFQKYSRTLKCQHLSIAKRDSYAKYTWVRRVVVTQKYAIARGKNMPQVSLGSDCGTPFVPSFLPVMFSQ